MIRNGSLACLLWMGLIVRSAQASVALPLAGYVKPGRCFPIQVDGADTGRSTTFTAQGCIPCRMDAQPTGRATLPMLVTGNAHQLAWPGGMLALHPPGENERLIGGIADQASVAGALFPGKTLLPVHLDPTDMLPGPPIAWETLDGIVLDSTLFQRISDSQRSTLLAGGVMLISVGESAPDHTWPWRQNGSCWILAAPVAGPGSEIVDENIYLPTFAWMPGWPSTVRGQVVGIAALLVLITTTLMLRPNRWTIPLVITLSLLTAAGVIAWRYSLEPIDRAGGDILLAREGLIQRDAFVYERAKETSVQNIPWAGWTHPLFGSTTALDSSAMQINLSANNQLSFSCVIPSGHTLAFLRREIQPGNLPAVISSQLSPMREVAKAEYLQAGDRITGELPGSKDRWPAVVIERKRH